MLKHKLVGIYLAAGNSYRFGNDKLRQPILGKPLGTMALSTALKSNLERVIAVTNKNHPSWLTPFSEDKRYSQIACPQSQRGQAHSIHCGLRYAETWRAEAIIIMLADQPFITSHMIDTIIETYKKEKDTSFIASYHNGITCPPVLFTRAMFPDLYKLKGDRGAKYLLKKKASEGIFLDFPYQKAFRDIDTITDYEHILQVDYHN